MASFEELARVHVDHVFAIALRLVGDPGEAEDVVQETLLRAWRGLGTFRGRAAFGTWLHRIAVNEAHRALQRGARRPPTVHLAPEQLHLSCSEDEPARQAEQRELRAYLESALLALPLPHRTAIVLRDIEGLRTRDAARIVGVGEAAFKSRLREARLKLRTDLTDLAFIATGG
jgi:RNA polymerase sigma-70 factor (ECF subfamily)